MEKKIHKDRQGEKLSRLGSVSGNNVEDGGETAWDTTETEITVCACVCVCLERDRGDTFLGLAVSG